MSEISRKSRSRANPEGVDSLTDPRLGLANERTFLAWNRTALALIGGGMAAARALHSGLGGGRLAVGLPLIVLGGIVGFAGISRWRSSERALRLRAPLSRPRLAPALLASGVGVIAVVSLVVLAIDQLR
jgi:putative membrane protein